MLLLALLLTPPALAEGIDETIKKPETAESWSWGRLFSWATGRDDFRSGKSVALVIGISAYSNGFTPLQYTENDPENLERRLVCQRTAFQKKVHSIHQYPFVVVVEFNEEATGDELIAPKHGTSWVPVLQ